MCTTGQKLIDSIFKLENSTTLFRCFVTWINMMKPKGIHPAITEIISTILTAPIMLSVDSMGVWLCGKNWMHVSIFHMTEPERDLFGSLILDEDDFADCKYDFSILDLKGYRPEVGLNIHERLAVVSTFLGHYILYKIKFEPDENKKFAKLTGLKSILFQLTKPYPVMRELCFEYNSIIDQCLDTIRDTWE